MNDWQLGWTSERSILAKAPESVAESAFSSQLAAWIHSQGSEMIRSVIPSATGVLIEFDIQHCSLNDPWLALVQMIESFESEQSTSLSINSKKSRELILPICYDERLAPDLNETARQLNCPPERVIELHTSGQYSVDTIGFMPGFGYLSALHDSLRLPRKKTPLTRVPGGSVGIAENMTAVYPHQSAGGWHLIGRTPMQLFNPTQKEPALLRVGDSVRFEQISHDEFKSYVESQQRGGG